MRVALTSPGQRRRTNELAKTDAGGRFGRVCAAGMYAGYFLVRRATDALKKPPHISISIARRSSTIKRGVNGLEEFERSPLLNRSMESLTRARNDSSASSCEIETRESGSARKTETLRPAAENSEAGPRRGSEKPTRYPLCPNIPLHSAYRYGKRVPNKQAGQRASIQLNVSPGENETCKMNSNVFSKAGG